MHEIAATSQDPIDSPCMPDTTTRSTPKSITSVKLLNTSFNGLEEEKGTLTRKRARELGMGSKPEVENAHGFKLVDATLLNDCISKVAICSTCRKPGSTLQLYQNNKNREGLAESLFLKCSLCGFEMPLSTSKRLGGQGGGSHEVNRRAVLASTQFGHAGLTQFCAGMNLPPPVTKTCYNEHLIKIEKAAIANAEEVMLESAKRLYQKIALEQPEKIEEFEEYDVACVGVTVDGTWQKRGHSSKIGVTFVISVGTGEVLDYSVKSLVCHQCKARDAMNKKSAEYQQWRESHQPNCQINHDGSAEQMEAVGAVEIFERSVPTRNLKYTTFVGDGDSSCYGKVKEAMEEKYGDQYCVTKEECVGHVQKRLGTALRKYKKDMKGRKLSDGKTVGGKGRLTDKVIDRMQNYYGKAIRENKGNLQGMQNSIKAIQCHMIRNNKQTLKKQHQHCPKTADTWCKFWLDQRNGTSLYKEDNRLPEVFEKELDPIFKRLSNNELLTRCLKGLTQNQNEAINGILWSKCPKTRFCGSRKVRIAVCETVAEFNSGAASEAVLMRMCDISEPGENSMRAFRSKDNLRIQIAAQKVSQKYRLQRQKQRFQRKAKPYSASYLPGSFGLAPKPETVTIQKT